MHRPEQVEVVTGSGDLYVAPSGIQGNGVFAARAFETGDLVERAPVLVCPAPQESLLEETDLWGFYFDWGGGAVAIALGFGSLYNHAWRANCRYEHDVELGIVDFYAVRPITPGEEVTVNYTGDPDGTGELWFSTDDPPPS
ncbi:MAG TPA: SET domain-containing protein [Acidimicrobiales bacterium]|nr:SET domain-containing protein [Acidimicrobiales bacterium]